MWQIEFTVGRCEGIHPESSNLTTEKGRILMILNCPLLQSLKPSRGEENIIGMAKEGKSLLEDNWDR